MLPSRDLPFLASALIMRGHSINQVPPRLYADAMHAYYCSVRLLCTLTHTCASIRAYIGFFFHVNKIHVGQKAGAANDEALRQKRHDTPHEILMDFTGAIVAAESIREKIKGKTRM